MSIIFITNGHNKFYKIYKIYKIYNLLIRWFEYLWFHTSHNLNRWIKDCFATVIFG
jgi:hypothetical protein